MSAKTLDLRGLTPDDAAHRINEAIAIEVLGWTKYAIPGHGNYFRDEKSLLRSTNFATSADVVLPLLEKTNQWSAVSTPTCSSVGYRVLVCITPPRTWVGEAATFPLAACIALLRANGVEVIT